MTDSSGHKSREIALEIFFSLLNFLSVYDIFSRTIKAPSADGYIVVEFSSYFKRAALEYFVGIQANAAGGTSLAVYISDAAAADSQPHVDTVYFYEPEEVDNINWQEFLKLEPEVWENKAVEE